MNIHNTHFVSLTFCFFDYYIYILIYNINIKIVGEVIIYWTAKAT